MALKPPLDPSDHNKWAIFYHRRGPFTLCQCEQCTQARDAGQTTYPNKRANAAEFGAVRMFSSLAAAINK